jgi:hypothetical protein
MSFLWLKQIFEVSFSIPSFYLYKEYKKSLRDMESTKQNLYRKSVTERSLREPKRRRVDNIRISIAEMYSQILEQNKLTHRLQWKIVFLKGNENLVSIARGTFLNHVSE